MVASDFPALMQLMSTGKYPEKEVWAAQQQVLKEQDPAGLLSQPHRGKAEEGRWPKLLFAALQHHHCRWAKGGTAASNSAGLWAAGGQ